MPTAAAVNWATTRPDIWERWLIVDSPAYDCQFVPVTKLTATLKASAAGIPSTPVGLKGSSDCNRRTTKRPRTETAPNASTESAYAGHRCLPAGSTPHTR